jgi:hypothetical protein
LTEPLHDEEVKNVEEVVSKPEAVIYFNELEFKIAYSVEVGLEREVFQ